MCKVNQMKKILIIFGVSLLTACGGGGSSDGASSEQFEGGHNGQITTDNAAAQQSLLGGLQDHTVWEMTRTVIESNCGLEGDVESFTVEINATNPQQQALKFTLSDGESYLEVSEIRQNMIKVWGQFDELGGANEYGGSSPSDGVAIVFSFGDSDVVSNPSELSR